MKNEKNERKKNNRGQISSYIYQQLKTDILSGVIESGTLLSEAEIGKRFNVSRSPVGVALNRLACERLVQSLPQRGHLVRTISISEIKEGFRLRELLEVEAARKAALRITDEEIESLWKIFNACKQEYENTPVLGHFILHTEIARLSGNRILADFITEILQLMQCDLSNHPQMGLFEMSREPEQKVIEAISSRDPKAAEIAMGAHIQEACEYMLKVI